MIRGQRYNGLHVLPPSLMKGIKGFVAILPSTVTSLIILCATAVCERAPEALDLPLRNLGITGWQQHNTYYVDYTISPSWHQVLAVIQEPFCCLSGIIGCNSSLGRAHCP